MKLKLSYLTLFALLSMPNARAAQPTTPPRIGVLLPGGAQYETLHGLRDGLKELGMVEGKHFALTLRDTKGDVSEAEKGAGDFERDKVALIYAATSPIVTAVKSKTETTPVVFTIGADPVSAGLVDGFARPGGRLTGVHYLVRDMTGKRLEVLKEILPKVSRVLTYYDPNNRVASESAALARDEAKRLGIKLIERQVANGDAVKKQLDDLKLHTADAFFFLPDPMVGSQSQLIIERAKAKKIPAMFQEHTLVAQGALASYGQNYRDVGKVSAKYVQRVLQGAKPGGMKIDTVDSTELAINLRTANELGIKVPPNVLARASKVIK
jgi:putative ABC transport system substrate-binding protein